MGETETRFIFTDSELLEFKKACIEYGSMTCQMAGGHPKPYRITMDQTDKMIEYIGELTDRAMQTLTLEIE